MLRRHIDTLVREALADTPVVLVNGARQTGKTTLVRSIAESTGGFSYVTLDDAGMLAAATNDPNGFVTALGHSAIIDEIQHAPALLPAIKASVDRDRRPGRFLLTGSANVLTLPTVSESLAGRMEVLTLRPLSQGEQLGRRETFVDRLMGGTDWATRGDTDDRAALTDRICRGGFPEAVGRAARRRGRWFASYITTILQRDVRDLANIEGLADAPRLLALLAARSAALLNVSEVSRSASIPNTTLQRYLALFEATYLIQRIRPWTANVSKRLVKTPKLLLGDTGLMAHLLNVSDAAILTDPNLAGPLLETFVGNELLKQIEFSTVQPTMLHYRSAAGAEVDFVLESGGRTVAGIEVKNAATLGHRDTRGLRSLAQDAGTHFVGGVILYTGSECIPFGSGVWGVPISALWA